MHVVIKNYNIYIKFMKFESILSKSHTWSKPRVCRCSDMKFEIHSWLNFGTHKYIDNIILPQSSINTVSIIGADNERLIEFLTFSISTIRWQTLPHGVMVDRENVCCKTTRVVWRPLSLTRGPRGRVKWRRPCLLFRVVGRLFVPQHVFPHGHLQVRSLPDRIGKPSRQNQDRQFPDEEECSRRFHHLISTSGTVMCTFVFHFLSVKSLFSMCQGLEQWA